VNAEADVASRGWLRARVIAYLRELFAANDQPFDARQTLVSSGLVNSLMLFELAMWIESEVGAAMDFRQLDLGREWDTVEGIVGFLEAARQA
jgi:acyl carrier protein